MPADFPLNLSAEYVAKEQPSALLGEIKNYILAAQPVALIHPHGFFIVLLRRDGQEDWRFHVWPRGKRQMTGMPGLIHTHDKVVDSRILKGQLSNSNYSVKTVEQGGFPVYDVTYIGDRYIATATNVLVRTNARVAPEVVDRRDLHPGESYRVDAHVFHQAEVTEAELTCTLVRMHSQSLGVIKVLGLDGYPAQIDFLRRQRSGADVVNLAEI